MITRCFIPIGRVDGRFVHRAFTLVELLVVIAVIGLLLGILMPALAGARRKALAISCSSRMQQICTASMMYTQDNEGQFARSSHSASVYGWLRWEQAFMPYLGYGRYKGSTNTAWDNALKKFYHCLADKRKPIQMGYGKNVWFELESTEVADILGVDYGPTYRTLTKVRHPAATIEFGEQLAGMGDHFMAQTWMGSPSQTDYIPAELDAKRHGNRANYGYLDGHILSQVFKETFDNAKKVDNWNPGTARQ
jgi:prepilin-type N-terminal cleavage/methylation domain-containing protein/prepilin-type processing-associated H-X9-DG protein